MTLFPETIVLKRLSDGLTYSFDRVAMPDGETRFKRTDAEIWILRDPQFGWIVRNPDGEVTGIPWHKPLTAQNDLPPEGHWVSKRGPKSYVYDLTHSRVVS